LPSSRKRSGALSDRAAAASAEIAKIVRGLQGSAREALTASNDGLRVAEDGAALAGSAERALTSILQGVDDVGKAVREVSHATTEQVVASQRWRKAWGA